MAKRTNSEEDSSLTQLVRPSIVKEIQDVDQEDQGKLEADLDGVAEEKVTLEEEDSFVRTLADPKLPSEDEVKKHNLEIYRHMISSSSKRYQIFIVYMV